MRGSRTMYEVYKKLWEQHPVEEQIKAKGYFEIPADEKIGRERFVIEPLNYKDKKVVAVSYSFIQNGDIVYDPEVVFVVNDENKEMIPAEFQNQFAYRVAYDIWEGTFNEKEYKELLFYVDDSFALSIEMLFLEMGR